jgi:predicted NAD/FAD-binding protein
LTEKIAVVGTGIAGMASAWLLSQRSEVLLIDKNNYVGGHTNTVNVNHPEGNTFTAVDTGFIVYNEPNYPHLVGLFDTLGVVTRPTSMTFSASILDSGLEYAGNNLDTLFAQRRNLISPRFLKLVYDIVKFNKHAKALIQQDHARENLTLGDFLSELKIGQAMQNDYLLPMAAAIWSCPPQQMRAFPAKSFSQFFNNHGLLNINDRPQWRTVVGGSQRYVEKLLATFPGKVITGNGAKQVERDTDIVTLTLEDGQEHCVDQVVFATHADEALALLSKPSEQEKAVLSSFRYQNNDTYLHTDSALMPKHRKVWSCWNYLAEKSGEPLPSVSVSYWMNALQGLDHSQDYFVSLNPIQTIDPDKIIQHIHYMHPVFDTQAMASQPLLASLQGQNRTWFTGSYFGYGFHEDALRSAVDVAKALGVSIPWEEH